MSVWPAIARRAEALDGYSLSRTGV